MTEHEKLEYIHSTLQDVQNCIEHAQIHSYWGKEDAASYSSLDEDMINKSLTMVEDIREKHFDKNGELIKL